MWSETGIEITPFEQQHAEQILTLAQSCPEIRSTTSLEAENRVPWTGEIFNATTDYSIVASGLAE
jgi:hypothetical protein